MTFVGMVFVLFGFGLSVFFSTTRGTWVPTWLFVYHAACSVAYWLYTLQNGADTYYYYIYATFEGFKPGTEGVGYFTALVRETTGGSYLDFFMFYTNFGWLGIVMLFDILRAHQKDTPHLKWLTLVLVFMPGLNFWTSAIGKDALTCFAIMLFLRSVYAANRISVGAIVGLLIAGVVRPHISMLLGASWGASLLFSSRTSPALRALTLGALGVTAAFAAPWVARYVGLAGLDVEAVDAFVTNRQFSDLDGGSAVDISQYPYPLQCLTFMFRPLFVDASGLFGLIVSSENVLYVGLFLWALPRLLGTLRGARATDFSRMNMLIWFFGVSFLGATIGNLGLALRQKCMILPSFFVIVFSALAAERPARVVSEPSRTQVPARARLAARPVVLPRGQPR